MNAEVRAILERQAACLHRLGFSEDSLGEMTCPECGMDLAEAERRYQAQNVSAPGCEP